MSSCRQHDRSVFAAGAASSRHDVRANSRQSPPTVSWTYPGAVSTRWQRALAWSSTNIARSVHRSDYSRLLVKVVVGFVADGSGRMSRVRQQLHTASTDFAISSVVPSSPGNSSRAIPIVFSETRRSGVLSLLFRKARGRSQLHQSVHQRVSRRPAERAARESAVRAGCSGINAMWRRGPG